jgi:dephospho-CoA kinase
MAAPRIKFHGLAIAGKKGAGKDMLADYFVATRNHATIIRCKTPIVHAYEQIVGHPYEKARDDAEMIKYSRVVIRKENDNICADWLAKAVPTLIEGGLIPVVPDMRRLPEFGVLKQNMLCIKIHCDDSIRLGRIYDREGTLNNYDPDDDTERDVNWIDCPYVIDNSKKDQGRSAVIALESILAELGLFQDVRLTRETP